MAPSISPRRWVGCAHNTVKAYRAIIASKGLTYEDLLACPTEELNQFFTSQKPEEDDDRLDKLEDAFKNADGELGKVGVTKFLLWNEYRLSNPDGYSYPSSVNSTASERRRTAREK